MARPKRASMRLTCQFKQHYRRTRREVFPILSRVQNVGYEQGENGRTPEWYRANHRTPWVAVDLEAKPFALAQGTASTSASPLAT